LKKEEAQTEWTRACTFCRRCVWL